ncbi:MAG: ROK family transcriptional regulator [Burkholderiales bacterium]|nr:ROK family transcriptional regulator [Anaerolineae bacterium]
MLKTGKATGSQVKRHNRQLLLRAVYNGIAGNRAALAQETGLTKPAVSDLVAELIDDGLLVEEGFGESTDSGGKRPRLLKFVPTARQVIGVSITGDLILGVLTNLDGKVIAEHSCPLIAGDEDQFFPTLNAVINGLMAQLSAPLLCIGIGIAAVVDEDEGLIRYAPHFGWNDVPLAHLLSNYRVPVYISDSTELAAMAQYAFGSVENAASLATVLVGDSVGVGLVIGDLTYHTGSDIGHLIFFSAGNRHQTQGPLEDFLCWYDVRRRAYELSRDYSSDLLLNSGLTYLHIRQALVDSDAAALALQEELTTYLAQIFAWIIALHRPDHISLAGSIADLGEPFLNHIVNKTRQFVLPELVQATTFSVDSTPNLVAIGAAAKSIQSEIGLI